MTGPRPYDNTELPMPTHPVHSTCWFEIPVTDLERSVAFYNVVLDTDMTIEEAGPNPVAFFPVSDPKTGISGHLYPGKPSTDGPTVHLVAPDTLAATKSRIEAAGGTVVSPNIDIPAGSFFYARDPDGNSIGIFQSNA